MLENLREDWQTCERGRVRQGRWGMAAYRFGYGRYRLRPDRQQVPFSFIHQSFKRWSPIAIGIAPCGGSWTC